MTLDLAVPNEFDAIYSAMKKSFISDEIRDYKHALSIMTNESAYRIYHITVAGEKIGFISVWELSDFTFAEHFVIYEKYRNRGYGGMALSLLKERYDKIILEVEPPDDDLKRRRLAFYERCGFVKNDFPYLQPPYKKDGNAVKLIIMSYPEKLNEHKRFIEEIYSRIYGGYGIKDIL